MSDVICDVCKRGCEPQLEALHHGCGHLVHLCPECYAAVGREYLRSNPTHTPLDGAVGSVTASIFEAAIAKARSEHACGDTGCPVSEAEVPPPEMPIVGHNLAEVVLEGCVRLWGADIGKRVAQAALDAICEASVRERQDDLVAKIGEGLQRPAAALAIMTGVHPRHASSSRLASVFDGVDRSAHPALLCEHLADWDRPHGRAKIETVAEVEGACPEMPRFHVGVDLAATPPPPAIEADGDVTQYPPLPASTRSSAPGVLRIVGRDPEDPGVVHVGVEAPRTPEARVAELRVRSADFLRDLLARVEGGDYLYFVGVAWGGKLGPGAYYSDLPSIAEALGHLEIGRVALTDEFFDGE